MSNRIKSIIELPKEFDLDKYDHFVSMSDKDFFRQVKYRQELVEFDKWGEELSHEAVSYNLKHAENIPPSFDYGDPFCEINSEVPEGYYEFHGGKYHLDKDQNDIDTSMRLSYRESITPLRRIEIIDLCKGNDVFGYRKGKPIIIDNSEVMDILHSYSGGMVTARFTDSINLIADCENLFIGINLNKTDYVIFDDLKRLLPLWRKELNIYPEDININSSWRNFRKKVIDYRVLPFIDLTAWANANSFSIPMSVMAIALFPNGERGEIQLAQTIKPFIEKFIREESLEKFKTEIS